MDIRLHQLEYFVTVAEDRNFTRAAARLHVAQPSVSAQIRKLERELGSPLFHRDPGGARLTQAGEVLLPLARRVLGDVEETRLRVGELNGLRRGELSVGATPSLSTVVLPEALVRFHARYPGVTVQLMEAGSRELVMRLESGELELALVILPIGHSGLATTALAEEELVMVVGPGHPLARRRRFQVADLHAVPLVMFRGGYDLRDATLAACRQAGFVPTFASEGGELDGVLALVAAGLGAAVVPSIAASGHRGLHVVQLVDPTLSRTIGLARHAGRVPSRAADAFVAELLASLPSTGWPRGHPAALRLLAPASPGAGPE